MVIVSQATVGVGGSFGAGFLSRSLLDEWCDLDEEEEDLWWWCFFFFAFLCLRSPLRLAIVSSGGVVSTTFAEDAGFAATVGGVAAPSRGGFDDVGGGETSSFDEGRPVD